MDIAERTNEIPLIIIKVFISKTAKTMPPNIGPRIKDIESIILLIELRLISLSLETIFGFAASKPIPKKCCKYCHKKGSSINDE